MSQKVAGLETQIGPRGSADIHSGKRSALRAWLMAKTGLSARDVLHLGTSELGNMYNDATDKCVVAFAKNPVIPAPDARPAPGVGAVVMPKAVVHETPESIEDLGYEPDSDEWKADMKTRVMGDFPTPVQFSKVAKQPRAASPADTANDGPSKSDAEKLAALITGLSKGKLDEARVREIAAEESAKVKAPERVIVVTPRADGEDRVDVGVQHRMFALLLKTVQAGLNPALVGPAGSGKTHAAHAVSVAMARAWELQGTCVTKSDITGFVDANGRYQTTPFSRSFSNGGILLCDEMDSWLPMATLALNAALANGHTPLPTGMQNRHPEWACIVAMNTYGTGASRQYVGRNQMDAATLNRLAFIAWDYDEALEASIVGVKGVSQVPLELEKGGIPEMGAWVKRVQKIRAAVASLKVRHIVSPRATMGGRALFEVGVGQSHVEDMLVWQGMDSEQRARVEAAAL